MDAQRQAIFQLEQIQPQWLDSQLLSWLYWLGSRGLVGLIMGIVIGGTAEVAGNLQGRMAYLMASLLAGLLVGAAEKIRIRIDQRQRSLFSRAVWAGVAILIPGLCYYVFFGLRLHMGQDAWRLSAGAAAAFGLVLGWNNVYHPGIDDVQPVEALSWSTRNALRGILPGLGILALSLVVVWAIFDRQFTPEVLRFGIVFGLIGLAAAMIIFGLRGRKVEQHCFPNQGVWLSWRNAARAGLLIGGATWLGYGLVYRLLPGLVMGVRAALLAGLWYGAFDGIKASLLRGLLAASRQIPLHMVNFLDYSAHLGLLQKVGGGYRFPSRLLQEYLAHQQR